MADSANVSTAPRRPTRAAPRRGRQGPRWMRVHATHPSLLPQLLSQILPFLDAHVRQRAAARDSRWRCCRRGKPMVLAHSLPVSLTQLLSKLRPLIGRQAVGLGLGKRPTGHGQREGTKNGSQGNG